MNKNILVCLGVVALVFLFLNYTNRSFLGDNGSLFISCLLSIIIIKSYNFNFLPTEDILILMIIPGLDLLRLSIERIIFGKHPFSPDRNHLHHHIVKRFSLNYSILILQLIFVTPFLISRIIDAYYAIILTVIIYLISFSYIFYKNHIDI